MYASIEIYSHFHTHIQHNSEINVPECKNETLCFPVAESESLP